MFQFRFDRSKKIQATGVVLQHSGRPMDWLRLLKILYIADREMLRETGRPILGGRIVAMDHGPLHSEIYDLLKGAHEDDHQWREHFATEGHTISLKAEPERLDLSPLEIEKLQEVTDRVASLGTWELSSSTHEFQEWKDCHAQGTSRPIPVEKLLKCVGFSDGDIQEIERDAKAHNHLLATLAE